MDRLFDEIVYMNNKTAQIYENAVRYRDLLSSGVVFSSRKGSG